MLECFENRTSPSQLDNSLFFVCRKARGCCSLAHITASKHAHMRCLQNSPKSFPAAEWQFHSADRTRGEVIRRLTAGRAARWTWALTAGAWKSLPDATLGGCSVSARIRADPAAPPRPPCGARGRADVWWMASMGARIVVQVLRPYANYITPIVCHTIPSCILPHIAQLSVLPQSR